MNERQPLVSIITPSHNQGRFIEETILSVRNQDYPNIEHTIIDGNSIDNTLEIIRKYDGTYNMQWISEPDEGQADAINKGLDIATGEIISWINSDDGYLNRNAVTSVVNEFRMEPNVHVIHGDRIIIDENTKFSKFRYSQEFNYEKYLLGKGAIFQETVFFRREVIEKFRLDKNLHFAMDTDLFLRIGRHLNIKHIKGIIGFFRNYKDNKSISEKYSDIRAAERKYLEKRYGMRLYKQTLNGGFVDQMIRKISRFSSGSYNRYANLLRDLFVLSGRPPEYFTIPIRFQRKLLLKYFLLSLKPRRESFD